MTVVLLAKKWSSPVPTAERLSLRKRANDGKLAREMGFRRVSFSVLGWEIGRATNRIKRNEPKKPQPKVVQQTGFSQSWHKQVFSFTLFIAKSGNHFGKGDTL